MESVLISKHLLESGYDNKVSWTTACLISSNYFCSPSVHLNFTLFDLSAVKGCSKIYRLDNISLQQFTMPMNACTSFVFLSSVIFTMASTLLFIDWIPVRVAQKPRYSISVFPNNNFSVLHSMPLSLIICSVRSNFSKQSD